MVDGGSLIVDSVVDMGCSMVAGSSYFEDYERSLVGAGLRKSVSAVHRLV